MNIHNRVMINEILYMECRLFRMYCNRHGLKASEGNTIFKSHGIWNYIEKTYDLLHLNGDESALSEINLMIENKKETKRVI